MEGALLTLAALACPVGMGLTMWFMAKGMRTPEPAPPRPEEMSIDELRRENRELDRELARLGGRPGEDAPR